MSSSHVITRKGLTLSCPPRPSPSCYVASALRPISRRSMCHLSSGHLGRGKMPGCEPTRALDGAGGASWTKSGLCFFGLGCNPGSFVFYVGKWPWSSRAQNNEAPTTEVKAGRESAMFLLFFVALGNGKFSGEARTDFFLVFFSMAQYPGNGDILMTKRFGGRASC